MRPRSISAPISFVEKHGHLCLAALVVVSVAVHAVLALRWFGETDAVRLANDALKALYDGSFHDLESQVYSTPLYLDGLRQVLEWGLVSARTIPVWMTVWSVLAGAAVTAGLFSFTKAVTRSAAMALAVAVLLQFDPAFFMFSIYGFPTMVAAGLFVLSVAVLPRAIAARRPPARGGLLLLAFLLYLAAVFIKVDVLLATAVFCLPVWLCVKGTRARALWIAGIVVAAGLSFVFFNLYSAHLVESVRPTGAWATHFSYFFNGIGAVWKGATWSPLVRGAGAMTLPLVLIAACLAVRTREGRSTVAWLALAALPLILNWAFMRGNSARHMLLPVVLLYPLLVFPLRSRVKGVWAVLLAAMLVVNYMAFAPTSNTVRPSGRLVESSLLLRGRAATLEATAKSVAGLPYPRVAEIGAGWFDPYVTYEVLLGGKYLSHSQTDGLPPTQTLVAGTDDGGTREYLLIYLPVTEHQLLGLAGQGYFLVLGDKSLVKLAQGHSELAGRWVSLDELTAAAKAGLR